MAQNIEIANAQYNDVPSIEVPLQGGGTAEFVDTSDADAIASEIDMGKTAYVNGVKLTGTRSGGGGNRLPNYSSSTQISALIGTITTTPLQYTVTQDCYIFLDFMKTRSGYSVFVSVNDIVIYDKGAINDSWNINSFFFPASKEDIVKVYSNQTDNNAKWTTTEAYFVPLRT